MHRCLVTILEKQLKFGKEYAKKKIPNLIHQINSTSTLLPFSENSIERIIALESAQHFKPFSEFISESHRVLKDDGILTASEIAQLDLNADWVILSACNTAAGDSPGAEGLSGLAKAFFYAGTRTLLVSHWSVFSNASTALTTQLFNQLRNNPSIGKSEALRRSMLTLMNSNEETYYAHPMAWAPFIVVGEGL